MQDVLSKLKKLNISDFVQTCVDEPVLNLEILNAGGTFSITVYQYFPKKNHHMKDSKIDHIDGHHFPKMIFVIHVTRIMLCKILVYIEA